MSTTWTPTVAPQAELRQNLGFFYLYSFVAFFSCICFVLMIWMYQCYKRGQSRLIAADAGMAHIIQQENHNHNSSSIELIYDCQPSYASPSLIDTQQASEINSDAETTNNNQSTIYIIQGEVIPTTTTTTYCSTIEAVNADILSQSLPHYTSYAVPVVPPTSLPLSHEIRVSSSPPVSARQFIRL